jgi:hypothetical protein
MSKAFILMIRNGRFGMLWWTRVYGYRARLVLISPHAFSGLHQDGKILLVNLTRKEIENSPSIETHKPVSRRYEEKYCRSYRCSCSWQGDAMWGMSGFPVIPLPPCPLPSNSLVKRRAKSQFGCPRHVHLLRQKIQCLSETKHFR